MKTQKDKCAYNGCKKPLFEGVSLHNTEKIIFPKMKLGESMHIECYIDYVVQLAIKKYENPKR